MNKVQESKKVRTQITEPSLKNIQMKSLTLFLNEE
jgi:hypothetical protein